MEELNEGLRRGGWQRKGVGRSMKLKMEVRETGRKRRQQVNKNRL
jgi:hypothetical protein